MTKVRTAVLATVASFAVAGAAVPAAGAATGPTPPAKAAPKGATYNVPVTGKAKNGKQFKGTYKIERFISRGGKTYAVGALSGTLGSRKVTRPDVQWPVGLTKQAAAPVAGVVPGGVVPGGIVPGTSGARAAQAACPVLNLTLGPLDLNLLGLRVQLNQVNLVITAIPTPLPGGGLLGSLLCAVSNLLNPQGLPTNQVTAILNSIISLLSAINPTAQTAAVR